MPLTDGKNISPPDKMSKGVVLMFFYILLFSLVQVGVKSLYHIPFFEVIFFRAIISFFLAGGTALSQKISLLGNNKKLLLLRGLFGTLSLTSFFYAIKHVPLASAITIVNIKPLIILLIAFFVLKEKIKPTQWLFFLVSFIGIIVVKGVDLRMNTLGLITVISAAIFAAIAHSIVRMLRETDQPIVILFYFTLVTIPVVGPFTLWHWVTPNFEELIILIAVGLFTHFGQLLLTKAYQSEELSKVSNMNYLGIVFAIIFGYFFFDETYGVSAIVGLALVIAGVIMNLIYVEKNKLKKI